MERFLYFRTEATDASDDARTNSACYPASSLVSMQPTGDTILALDFLVDGESSTVLLNLTAANTHITAIQAITHSITTGKSFTNKRYLPALIIVANDDSGGTEYLEGSGIASCGTIIHASSVLKYAKITSATAVEIIDIDTKRRKLTSMTLANVHTGDATVQVYLLNAAGTLYYIIKDVIIPTGMTLKLEADELDYDGDIFNLYVKLGGSTPVDVIVR
tara:strand:- start:3 stop:656 length:654 start_codon:yes stop_codon:yes gene_type:complete